MLATLTDRQTSISGPTALWKGIPSRIKVLYIATASRPGQWLSRALVADSAVEFLLEEAVGTAAGLARLREEAFDAVLVSHDPAELNALDMVEGYRAGGAEEPIVVLGDQSEQEIAVLCYEVGADGYVCVPTATTRNLIWVVARAIQHHQLVRDNEHLRQAEQTRLQREHDEARRLLQEQWALIEEFRAEFSRQDGADRAPEPVVELPAELVAHYRELLRIYVIMGSGNLAAELHCLAKLLVNASITTRQTVQLHLEVAEEMVQGLGARSTRHVMTRADLLIFEVLLYLAEGYRRRYEEQLHPPVQRLLPGF